MCRNRIQQSLKNTKKKKEGDLPGPSDIDALFTLGLVKPAKGLGWRVRTVHRLERSDSRHGGGGGGRSGGRSCAGAGAA